MKAAELMSKEVLTIPAYATVLDAMTVMRQSGIRHLPVIDSEDTVVGMLSDRDLLALPRPALANDGIIGPVSPLNSAVNAFMSRNVYSVTPDTDVTDAIDIMLNHDLDAVPVLDETRKLQGIVTTTDILTQSRYRL